MTTSTKSGLTELVQPDFGRDAFGGGYWIGGLRVVDFEGRFGPGDFESAHFFVEGDLVEGLPCLDCSNCFIYKPLPAIAVVGHHHSSPLSFSIVCQSARTTPISNDLSGILLIVIFFSRCISPSSGGIVPVFK